MLNHDEMAAAVADAVALLDRPGGDGPTPCAGWTVYTLANHVRQVLSALDTAGRSDAVPPGVWAADVPGVAADAADGWKDPAAWQRTIEMGGMAMPAPMVAAMLTCDLVLHGWDLARATGREFPAAPAAAAATYDFVAGTAEQGRGMGLYAAPVAVAADASPLARALGLSGRNPSWSAPIG